MTGVALATVSLDVHWHDTYFVVAHFHFIMVGATLMAFLAALHYWFPKMFGRMYPEGWGLVAAVMIILGFNFTFIPQFLLGNVGMPRRYFSYPERVLGAERRLDGGRVAARARARRGPRLPARRAEVGAGRRARTRGTRAASSGTRRRRRRPRTSRPTPVYTHGPHEYDDAGREARRRHASRRAASMPADTPYLAHHFENLEKQAHAARLGMWLFLATEVLLFGGAVRRRTASTATCTRTRSRAASRGLETWIGVVNTIVLVTSSFTVAMGLDAARRGRRATAPLLLFARLVLLAVVFLGFKAVEYSHHFHAGELPGRFYTRASTCTAPGGPMFYALYFLITGLHAIHVVIGMTVLAVVGWRAGRGAFTRRSTTCRSSSRASTGTSSTSSGSSSSRSSTSSRSQRRPWPTDTASRAPSTSAIQHHSHAGRYVVVLDRAPRPHRRHVPRREGPHRRAAGRRWSRSCIATVKGALVALFFMHLWDQRGANRLVFVTSLVFVALLIGLIVVIDYATRFPLANPPGSPGALPPPDYRSSAAASISRARTGSARRGLSAAPAPPRRARAVERAVRRREACRRRPAPGVEPRLERAAHLGDGDARRPARRGKP